MAIERFNETVNIWISELNSFTVQQFLIKPDSKSWSLGQVYGHIIEETNWYNKQIEVSLADFENVDIPITMEAQKLFNEGSFPNKRILGDPMISENVKQPTSIYQLKSDLEKLKTHTNEIWDRMKNADSYGKSEHPGIGYLNCFEWLHYSEMHMRHHLRQKSRIENFLKERLQ